MMMFISRSLETKVVLSIIILCLVSSAQGAMLTSSVYAGTSVLRLLVSGTNSCSDSSVPAACSFSGTVLDGYDRLGPIQGSASAIPSLYAIDHAVSITGNTYNMWAHAEAEVATEFVITGVNGSGFVQYQVSGDASTGSDYLGSDFRLRHGLLPEEFTVVFPYVFQPQSISFTSQLYPVQFGEPFSFEWGAYLGISGTGSEVAPSRYMRLQLEILVLDSEERSLANAIVTETPEPAGFGLLLSGLGVMGFVFRLRRPSGRLRHTHGVYPAQPTFGEVAQVAEVGLAWKQWVGRV